MARDLKNIRNIGVIAHIDAGKTTVTERMLFYSGASHRMGEVDKGTTETDFDEEEQQRGITIYSACVTFNWKDVAVNLIDTPGHVDFTAEVERSLRVLDGGVVVFSAREGVEAQSETVWHQADKYHVPRLAFINKMDREGADFERTLAEIEKRLGAKAKPVALQIPIGAGPPHVKDAFNGIVDLIEMKMLTFTPESQGAQVIQSDLPGHVAEAAELWRGQMLEHLYDFSNELMERALAEEDIPVPLLRSVIRDATVHNLIVPVFCGAALDFVGIQPLLDGVAHYLPSPADMPPVEGANPKKRDSPKKGDSTKKGDSLEKRKPDSDEPFCGLVFKILADRHGDLYYVRVYSGQLKSSTRVYNATQDIKENAAQLWHIHASRKEQISLVEAGDIVGVIGLRNSVTGDTLCDTKHPIVLETIVFPETVISMAIEPETTAERKKLADTLTMLKKQDPTFRASESEETGQTLISGMGELHLEVIKHRLLRDFNLNVKVHKPRVSYRETVERAVEVVGECHRQIAGQQTFAKVKIRLEPNPGTTQPVTGVGPVGDDIPPELLSIVVESLTEAASGGGQLGYPLLKVKITVIGGEAREGESTDVAFRIAASDAFEKALREAGIVLLEPIMKLEITTPEEYLGDFIADLQQRRGIIDQTFNRGTLTVIEAHAPLAELFGYSGAMRGLSQGRANCSMEPAAYGPAPAEVRDSFL